MLTGTPGAEWLGAPPAGWQRLPLKRLLTRMSSGGTPSTDEPAFWGTDETPKAVPWVSIGDMTAAGVSLAATAKRVTPEGMSSAGLEVYPAGTLLLSMYASVGKTTVLTRAATCNQAIIALETAPEIHQPWLRYWLEYLRAALPRYAAVSTQLNLNAFKVANLPVFVPPPAVQRQIAERLDHQLADVDAVLTARQQQLADLGRLRAARVGEWLRDAGEAGARSAPLPWLGDIPASWRIVRLSSAYSVELGQMLQPEPQDATWIQVPYFRTANIRDGAVDASEMKTMWVDPDRLSRFAVREGDLLVCEGGEIGRSSLCPPLSQVTIAQNHVHVVRALRNDSLLYLHYLLSEARRSGYFDAVTNGATIKSLTAQRLRRLQIPLPLPKVQQRLVHGIEAAVHPITAVAREIEAQVTSLSLLKDRLIADAVTGLTLP